MPSADRLRVCSLPCGACRAASAAVVAGFSLNVPPRMINFGLLLSEHGVEKRTSLEGCRVRVPITRTFFAGVRVRRNVRLYGDGRGPASTATGSLLGI